MSRDIVSFTYMPASLKDAEIWTPHTNKRPVAEPGALHKCVLWKEAIQALQNSNGKYSGIGINLSLHNPLACIDIDPPKDPALLTPLIQQRDKLLKANVNPASREYAKWLTAQEYIKQAQDAGLHSLMQFSYVELSPSLLGLHIWVNVVDKEQAVSAYIKSRHEHVRGQLSLHTCFMTSTGIHLAGSCDMLAPISLMSFPKLFHKHKLEQSQNDANSSQKQDPD